MTDIGRDSLPGAVIVISSHVARGSVGNRAVVFALEALGLSVWAVPTVLLPWHPGHGPATAIVPEPDRFSAFIADLGEAPWLGEVAAVVTGYLGAPGQAAAIAGLVRRLKAVRPSALYACDPVIGDQEGLYVPGETAASIRDILLPLADLATPNRYELAWLTGAAVRDEESAVAAARRLGPASVLVTSAPAGPPQRLANLLVEPLNAFHAAHRMIDGVPKGTGDLTAALFVGHRLAGKAPMEALAATTASVLHVLRAASAQGADELMLASSHAGLVRPEADPSIEVRALPAEARDETQAAAQLP